MNIDPGEFDALQAQLAEFGRWLGELAELNRDPAAGLPPAAAGIIERALEQAFEDGETAWAHDLGLLLAGMRGDGASDARLLGAVLEMVEARMRGGPPAEWFGPGDADG